jgi:histidine triad (HIT) family protein
MFYRLRQTGARSNDPRAMTGMTNTPQTYDPSNVFAKILRGELPAHKLYEDADTLAIMDIMPRCPGHCLVIPKSPARNMLDATPVQLAACLATAQKLSRAVMKAFSAQGVTLQQFNESAGGQVVFHLHYHVLPRHTGIPLGPHSATMEKQDVLTANADKIRAALAKA